MKVRELIKLLRELPKKQQNMEVRLAYGDCWNNRCAPLITDIRVEDVGWSAYHYSSKVLEEVDEEKNPDAHVAVVLGYDNYDPSDDDDLFWEAFDEYEEQHEDDEK